MIGPGRYDDLCTEVREKTDAAGVIVIVIDGNKGSGFSCQSDLLTLALLPEMLEFVADKIRRDGPA